MFFFGGENIYVGFSNTNSRRWLQNRSVLLTRCQVDQHSMLGGCGWRIKVYLCKPISNELRDNDTLMNARACPLSEHLWRLSEDVLLPRDRSPSWQHTPGDHQRRQPRYTYIRIKIYSYMLRWLVHVQHACWYRSLNQLSRYALPVRANTYVLHWWASSRIDLPVAFTRTSISTRMR